MMPQYSIFKSRLLLKLHDEQNSKVLYLQGQEHTEPQANGKMWAPSYMFTYCLMVNSRLPPQNIKALKKITER